MTVYPYGIDDDSSIIRIDDNLSELGTAAINQLREAVFAIEQELGIKPSGAKLSVAERINIALNPDGTLNTTNLNGLGIATLPIGNSQVGNAAGIIESKLALDYSTAYLNTKISTAQGQIDTLGTFTAQIDADLLRHIAGATKLSNNSTLARHVASQVDINAVPNDARDAAFIWTGIKDRGGNLRSGTQVAKVLQQVNDELVAHENATVNAHPASAIALDATGFTEIPKTTTDVQLGFEYVDQTQSKSLAWDRSIFQSNGIPLAARSERLGGPDGYSIQVLPPTPVAAYLSLPTNTAPYDDIYTGDDLLSFQPISTASPFTFDSQFTKVAIGDIVRIDYGDGFTYVFSVTSTRYTPGSEWVVRIDGTNKFRRSGTDGYGLAVARIDRPRFETGTQGVFAVAPVIPDTRFASGVLAGVPNSVIVGSPTGASAVGVQFNPSEINSNHYNLYLRLYPGGDPTVYVDLPAVDVSGNAGASPGSYTLDSVVFATNQKFRQAGFNYRFIAFNHKGNFGLMLADSYNKASFSIVSGTINGAGVDPFGTNNVIDDTGGFDALGFGKNKIALASPVITSGIYSTPSAAASHSTIVITPRIRRVAVVDGFKIDFCKPGYLANADGYWPAVISDVQDVLVSTTRTATYEVDFDLRPAGLFIGKTIVVQPVSTPDNSVSTYGRYIISNVFFDSCGGAGTKTYITVVNAVHGTGIAEASILGIGTNVRLFFSDDSVSFDQTNLVGNSTFFGDTGSNTFHRYHELFVDKYGKTFPIERARMVKQVEASQSGKGLKTDIANWKIVDVSKKLKGFQDPNLNFRRFVRFYVLSYNTATGEYSGYIGMRGTSDLISNTGTIVRTKKNVPTRFYDHSNVDYVTIQYDELAPSPGTDILSSSDSYAPRFVDIEIFPSQELDDEVMRLAGVSHNDTAINTISDFREFGTLSEKNFTDSAVKFIEAGERYLHSNGIIRGFEYLGTGATANQLIFNGGLALVNGKFVAVDAQTINITTIQRVRPTSGGDLIKRYICVDESGNLVEVLCDKDFEMFEYPTGYFIRSVKSFVELVDKLKTLTPIAVWNTTATDARRFIYNTGEGFSWGPADGNVPASFRNWDAVQNWVNEYGNVDKVIVRGIIDVPSTLSVKLHKPLVLEGLSNGDDVFQSLTSGCFGTITPASYLNITANTGFDITGDSSTNQLNAQLVFRNITFVYAPPAADTGDIMGISSGFAGIKIRECRNLVIEKCTFRGGGSWQPYLPPSIYFHNAYLSPGGTGGISGVYIRNNRFNSETNGPQFSSVNKAAILFAFDQNSTACNLSDVFIENNDCSSGTIGIGPIVTGGSLHSVPASTFTLQNVVIRGNRAGMIGVFSQESAQDSCVITENNAAIITNAFVPVLGSGKYFLPTGQTNLPFQLGGITVTDNTATAIILQGSANMKSFIVSNNRLRNSEAALVDAFWSGFSSSPWALTVTGYTPSNGSKATITGNVIEAGDSGYYLQGIGSCISGTITGNDVSGFTSTGIGVSNNQVLVSSNTVRRADADTVGVFISSGAYMGVGHAPILNNYLSHQTVGPGTGGSETTINGGRCIGNINHVQNKKLNLDIGYLTNAKPYDLSKAEDGDGSPGLRIANFSRDKNQITMSPGSFSFLVTGSACTFILPIASQLPDGAKILRVHFTSFAHDQAGGHLNAGSNLRIRFPYPADTGSGRLWFCPDFTVVALDTIVFSNYTVDLSAIDTATMTDSSLAFLWFVAGAHPNVTLVSEIMNCTVDYVLAI